MKLINVVIDLIKIINTLYKDKQSIKCPVYEIREEYSPSRKIGSTLKLLNEVRLTEEEIEDIYA